MKRNILTYFLYIKVNVKQLLKRLVLKLWPFKDLEGFPLFIYRYPNVFEYYLITWAYPKTLGYENYVFLHVLKLLCAYFLDWKPLLLHQRVIYNCNNAAKWWAGSTRGNENSHKEYPPAVAPIYFFLFLKYTNIFAYQLKVWKLCKYVQLFDFDVDNK